MPVTNRPKFDFHPQPCGSVGGLARAWTILALLAAATAFGWSEREIWAAFADDNAAAIESPPDEATQRLRAEIDKARQALKAHPSFSKYYAYLETNPETLAKNGPKLAALLWDEANKNQIIRQHPPSQLAALEEVERLAAAGGDFMLALDAVDAQRKVATGGPSAAEARAKAALLLRQAFESDLKSKPEAQVAALKTRLQANLNDAIQNDDETSLRDLFAANASCLHNHTERMQFVTEIFPFAEAALAEEHLAAAAQIVEHVDGLLKRALAGNARKEATDHNDELKRRLKLAQAATQAQLVLAVEPGNAEANFTVGTHVLYNRRQWEESLTYLALGTDSAWQVLAKDTLKAPSQGSALAALADRWSKVDELPDSAAKLAALQLYRRALMDAQFVGFERAAVEEKSKGLAARVKTEPNRRPPLSVAGSSPTTGKTIGTASKENVPLNQWIDLLPLVNFDRDTMRGYWLPLNGSVMVESVVYSRLRLPIRLQGASYDATFEIDCLPGTAGVNFNLPVGQTNVMAMLDGYGDHTVNFITRIGDSNAARDPRTFHGRLLEKNKTYRVDISVRLKGNDATLTVALNGEKKYEYDGSIAELRLPWCTDEEVPYLGLATSESPVIFRNCRVRVVEGDGQLLPEEKGTSYWPAEVQARKAIPLTALTPNSHTTQNNTFAVSTGTRDPILGGKDCKDYVFAHAPSRVVYTIPPKAKYFTAVAYAARSPSVKFSVKADGQTLFESQDRAMVPVTVELPAGSKELELECDPLGNVERDHSCWCYPAFR